MTKDELIKRMRAGELVTLYHPWAAHVGVGSRTFALDRTDKHYFRITYDNKLTARYHHKLDSSLLDTLFKTGHMMELWWVAYARSVALNQEAEQRRKQDA